MSEDLQAHVFLEKQLDWSPNTVVDWKNFMRDVCIGDLFSKDISHEFLPIYDCVNSEPIGGLGTIVEIDEPKLGKRKYNRRRLLTGQWVFGMFETGTNIAVMIVVPDRSLLPIIQQYILPGTTIHSDEWASYAILQYTTYVNHIVNHSQNFVEVRWWVI
ncbi:hypothetical protein LOD99_7069 [Oopsacas minuta]|uniref:ISXO2-like transposase domain-containing protein n=1 Tax=Oopsacas minuta TaxID=111878 RepID=A0AAV7JJ46_9METZ|nr:hypothetical protein LOD99_7069 [Oopsacas minuta]